jgi:hypothetical protein
VKDIHPIQFGLDTELVLRTGVPVPPGGSQSYLINGKHIFPLFEGAIVPTKL